jgi:hypothetical protein
MDRYKFVDAIVRAAIVSSPHTTPQKYFPATEKLWHETVETEIFGTPVPSRLQELLKIPAKDYLTEDDEDDEDDDNDDNAGELGGSDVFEVIRFGTPPFGDVTVDAAILP